MASEEAPDEGRGGTATAGELMRSALERAGAGREAWTALALWLDVAGAAERAHTAGAFLREPSRPGSGPTLIVYVDSSACVVDYRARSEVYLARLAAQGTRLAGLEFRLSRHAGQRAAARPTRPCAPAMPPLTDEEESEAARLAQEAPEALRPSVFRAICASFRREKWERSKNEETSR